MLAKIMLDWNKLMTPNFATETITMYINTAKVANRKGHSFSTEVVPIDLSSLGQDKPLSLLM